MKHLSLCISLLLRRFCYWLFCLIGYLTLGFEGLMAETQAIIFGHL